MKNERSVVRWAVSSAFVVCCLAVGFVLGAWFTQNYRIVRIDDGHPLRGVGDPVLNLADESSADLATAGRQAAAPTPTASLPVTNSRGIFSYRFTPGEQLRYKLDTKVSGRGFESIGPSDVAMRLSGDMSLKTESVDSAGTGNLVMTYDRMSVDGDFMGSDYRFDYTPQGTLLNMNGQTKIETSRGVGSTEGIPQINFFEEPIEMSVAPNGRVLSVRGGAGSADMIKDLPAVSSLEFPEGDAQPGVQWYSDFTLPIPGAGEPAKARMRNTLLGYQHLGGRYCAVIQQDIDANQRDGTLGMPRSVLGDAIGFQMPVFELSGRNFVYFDVQRGQMAHTVSDLELTMKLGSVLGETSSILGGAAKDLAEVFGGQTSGLEDIFGDAFPGGQGLDLVLDIDSTMTLADLQGVVAPPQDWGRVAR